MLRWIPLWALTLIAAAPVRASEGGASEDVPVEILLFLLFILVISIFLGVEVISKVPSLLHTPLMSGSNAISGITILGSMIAAGIGADHMTTSIIGACAVGFAMINVVGGYLVTDRMLHMFKKKEAPKSGGKS